MTEAISLAKALSDYGPWGSLVQDLLVERPEAIDLVQKANVHISKGSFYGALREYRKLI